MSRRIPAKSLFTLAFLAALALFAPLVNRENARAYDLMALLAEKGIRAVDLRAMLTATPKDLERSFYRTDHHWNNDAVFRVFGVLAPEIARAARLDPAAVAPVVAANAWTREVRPRCFTGTKSRRTGHHLAAMFGAAPIVDGAAIFWSREMIVPLACAVIGSAPILKSKLLARPWLMALGYVVQFALFIVSISCLVMNAHNPFIYFNF